MNQRNTVLLTGGTGLIGTALTKFLVSQGNDVIILSRKMPDSRYRIQGKEVQYAEWNIEKQHIDEYAIKKADHIIHLAGANIAEKRWTPQRKKEIRESRSQSSALLVKALKEIPNNIKTIVSASAIGWYGEDKPGDPAFIEEDPPAEGFLGETCKAWEESIEPVKQLGKRLVKLRTGIVLTNQGGALAEFKKSLHFGMATILGSGKQVISWIHIDDLCRMYAYAIEQQELRGAYNAVSTNPVSNKDLILKLAKLKRGKFFIPVHIPAFALKIAIGEMSVEVLKSTTVSNQKIRQAGFRYLYPSIESCLSQLVKESQV